MFSKALLFALPFLLAVNAQSSPSATAPAIPTSTSALSPCILTCTTLGAAQAGCAGITDVQCACTNQKFQQIAGACLQANCTSTEQAAAKQLQGAECASFPGAGNASAAGSGTPSAGSPPSAAASSKAAAVALKPFALSTTHAIGAVGVVLMMVAGTATLL